MTHTAPSEVENVRRWGTFGWTALVAGIALASSIVAIVFELWPSLKPDPRTTLGAELAVLAVDPGVTEGAYIRRTTLSEADFQKKKKKVLEEACGPGATAQTCGVLSLPGEEVYVQTTVQGFKRRSIEMRDSLYSARTGLRVPGASNVEVSRLQLQAPTDTAVVPIWVICPPGGKRDARYFVRIELYHAGDNVLLAMADSNPFAPGTCIPA